MAVNEVFSAGDQLEVAVPAGCVSGTPVTIGNKLPGVCLTSRNSAGKATVKFVGVYRMSVTFAGNKSAGAPIYVTPTNTLSDTATSNFAFGLLWEDWTGDAGTGTVLVRVGFFA